MLKDISKTTSADSSSLNVGLMNVITKSKSMVSSITTLVESVDYATLTLKTEVLLLVKFVQDLTQSSSLSLVTHCY